MDRGRALSMSEKSADDMMNVDCKFCRLTKGAFRHIDYGYHIEKSTGSTHGPEQEQESPMVAAQAKTVTATKTDVWRDYPEVILIPGLDGKSDDSHLFADPERNGMPGEEFIESIAGNEKGVFTPLWLYRLEADRKRAREDPSFVAPLWLIAGRKRTLGAREDNRRRAKRGEEKRKVPYFIFMGTDKEAYELYIAENEAREENSMLGRARIAHKYLTAFFGLLLDGTDDKKNLAEGMRSCARHMKCSAPQVENLLRYKSAPAPFHAAVERGDLPAHAVVAAVGSPNPKATLEEKRTQKAELVARLPTLIDEFKTGKTTVKDVARQEANKKRESKGQETVSPLPGRRVWAKLVDLVDKEEIAINGPKEKEGIDLAVVQMAKYLAGGNARIVPGLTAALRKAGFEIAR